MKRNRRLIFCPTFVIIFDFVFQIPPALSCSVAISVDRLQHDCHTGFNHSAAPVTSHSDEEN